MTTESVEILDLDGVNRALTRIAHEIIEKNKGVEDLVLIGIRTGGAYLGEQIQQRINEIESITVPFGSIDITMYRDDLASRGHLAVGQTDIRFNLDGKRVVLVDDVLFTGRTIRAAMDAVMDLGRPQSIQLAILIDRGHRELPIRPDYIGRNLPTSRHEQIKVDFDEQNNPRAIYLLKS
ncbi:MAG: bifunctional pyr operon transcriptional regulator/uracil phosphoribosyltransferase PyrR [Pelovirga sp.]